MKKYIIFIISALSTTFLLAQPGMPDLKVDATPTVSSISIEDGSSITVSVSVSNTGGSDVTGTRIGLKLSNDQTVGDADDIHIGYQSVTSLNAGQTRSYNISRTIPSGTSAGTYYLYAWIDYQQTFTVDVIYSCGFSVL